MKSFPLLLVGSLAANLALVALLVTGADSAKSTVTAREKKPGFTAHATTPGPATWGALQSEDLATQAARLRDEGFPPDLIRAILAARNHEAFAARFLALAAAQTGIPYWKHSRSEQELAAAYRELSNAEHKVLNDLLGPDPAKGNGPALRRQFPNWPADKIDALAGIRDRYDEQRDKLSASIRGAWLPEDQEKLNALGRTMHADLAAMLSPAELSDYDLRTSDTADNLRYRLSAFGANEQEFRTLYQLQSAFDTQFSPYYSTLSDDQRKARNAAENQLNDAVKTALGDARYADYQRANDYGFRQTSQLVDRLGLPPETATQVYTVQQDIQQRATALSRDRTLPPGDRTAQLAALSAEADARLTASLGAEGYTAYHQYGGRWLQQFKKH